MYNKFPSRQDRLISIGDATPAKGSCSGHPGSSHGSLKAMDFSYYTHETNETQWGDNVTTIWGTDGILEYVFDWERNYLLWKHIYSIFPESRGTVDRRIKEYMSPLIASKYGTKAYSLFQSHILGDDPENYNHHLHIHFKILTQSAEYSLEDIINYDYVVK